MKPDPNDYEDLGDITLTPKIQLKFGLQLPDGTENPKAVWGARTITDNSGTIDIVFDRQSSHGPKHETQRLVGLINANMVTIKENYKKKLNSGAMSMTESNLVELFADTNNRFYVHGNTNGSCGYLYLVAWTE